MDTPADVEHESAAPTGGRERGRRRGGFRGGRSRGRGRGRGRGTAARGGEDDAAREPYVEMETTASIVEIVETEEIPVVEEVESAPVEPSPGDGGRGGRGRGRGRGWRRGYRGRRGRGRGRGAAPTEEGHEGEQAGEDAESRPPRQRRRWPPRQHLTHFISLPIGHHVELQNTIKSFTDALLAADPAIAGLDPTVVIPAQRLHLTLGVMSLAEDSDQSAAAPTSDGADQSSPPQKPSLASAIAHLESLKPKVKELLAGQKLRVELSTLDIIRPDWGDLERAGVMYVAPAKEGEPTERLKTISGFISKSFRDAGFLVDERRPLKLHCTLLNTNYRRPRPKGQRAFFSYASVLTSDALRAIALDPDAIHVPPPSGGESSGANGELASQEADTAAADAKGKGRARTRVVEPVHVDLGVWDVDEVQICEMGSHGPEGEYVCVGKIALE